MFSSRWLILLIPVFLFSCVSGNSTTDSKPGKWVALFNGKNLDHWKVKIAGYEPGNNYGNTFRVEIRSSVPDTTIMIASEIGLERCIMTKNSPITVSG